MSYTAGKAKIQLLKVAGVAVCLLAGGCGQVTMPLGSADVETPLVLTGSVPSSIDIAAADVGPEDREIIAETLELMLKDGVALSLAETEEAKRLTWSSPESGNSGKISDVDNQALDETGCLSFKTTANTIAGVRIYNGTACRDIRQLLTVTALSMADA